MRRILMVAALLAAFAPAVAQAQQTDAEKEVLAAVEKFFAGFNAKDTVVMKSMLYPGGTLLTTGTNREGQPIVMKESMDGFLKIIAGAPVTLEEKLFEPEVRVDDNLATVWTRYELWADGKFSHCGVDAFQLVRTVDGWKIAVIADTRRRNCGK